MSIAHGWLKNSTGSSGNLTFVKQRGATIFKNKSLGPTGDPTLIQIGNRAAFAVLVAIGKKIGAIIPYGWREFKTPSKPGKAARTVKNAFNGENRKYDQDVFDYTVPNVPVADFDNLLASKGSITVTEPTEYTVSADVSAQTLQCSFSPFVNDPTQTQFDELYIVAYNETTNLWGAGVMNGATPANPVRNDAVATVPSPVPFIITDVVKVYFFFRGVSEIGIGGPVYTGKESTSLVVTATVVA